MLEPMKTYENHVKHGGPGDSPAIDVWSDPAISMRSFSWSSKARRVKRGSGSFNYQRSVDVVVICCGYICTVSTYICLCFKRMFIHLYIERKEMGQMTCIFRGAFLFFRSNQLRCERLTPGENVTGDATLHFAFGHLPGWLVCEARQGNMLRTLFVAHFYLICCLDGWMIDR